LGIGDWGLGIGPIPNPQSPIPNPQSPIPINLKIKFILKENLIINYKIKIIKNVFYKQPKNNYKTRIKSK
jgi:hypothetical protein